MPQVRFHARSRYPLSPQAATFLSVTVCFLFHRSVSPVSLRVRRVCENQVHGKVSAPFQERTLFSTSLWEAQMLLARPCVSSKVFLKRAPPPRFLLKFQRFVS